MRILEEWLKQTYVPLDHKISMYKSLKQSGICVLQNEVTGICSTVKVFLQTKGYRAEGLLLFDLVLDKINDTELTNHIVFFMKTLLDVSQDEKLSKMCHGILHRIIIRLSKLPYVQREVSKEIFPQLMQNITRGLAKSTVSSALLNLTRVTVSHFGKMCAPNREPLEKFISKHLVRVERLDNDEAESVALTFSNLANVVSDPESRHGIQTSYLDMMIRSCELTERLFMNTANNNGEDISSTIYEKSKVSPIPTEQSARIIIWRRLIYQLRTISHLIASPISKTINADAIFNMLDKLLIQPRREEHLFFFQSSIFQSAVEIAQAMIKVDRKMIMKNNRFTNFFVKALELTIENESNDLTHLRPQIYEAMSEWLQSFPPVSFYTHKEETLLRIVKITSVDVSDEKSTSSLLIAALRLQKAIISAYGELDKEVVRQILLQMIPASLELSRPFRGNFVTSSTCRLKYYELLLAFCTSSNASLMPPTPEIEEIIVEGIQDDVYEVRELCKDYRKITLGIVNPMECAFKKSASHALHEHHRTVKQLALTKIDRTRNAETQTVSAFPKPEKFIMTDKIVKIQTEELNSSDDYSDVEPTSKAAKKRSLEGSYQRPPKASRPDLEAFGETNGHEVEDDFDEEVEGEEEYDEEEEEAYESFTRNSENPVVIPDDDEEQEEDEEVKEDSEEDENIVQRKEECGAEIIDEDDDCIVYNEVQEPSSDPAVQLKAAAIKHLNTEDSKQQNGTQKSNGDSINVRDADGGVIDLVELKPVEEDMEDIEAAVVAVGSDEEDYLEEQEEPTGGLVLSIEKNDISSISMVNTKQTLDPNVESVLPE